MTMPPGLRRLALTAHVATSVGLLGAVAAFLALAIAGLAGSDAAVARTAYPAMATTAWYVVLPLILAALAIGVIESVGTSWGLLAHYWIVAKLLLTAFAIFVLVLQMRLIDFLAVIAAARPFAPGELFEARLSLIVHSGGGLLVLLLPTALSIYKPRGRTHWGS
jgi:hypothetical protein